MMFPELKNSLFSLASRDARQLRKRVEYLEVTLKWVADFSTDVEARSICRIALEHKDELV